MILRLRRKRQTTAPGTPATNSDWHGTQRPIGRGRLPNRNFLSPWAAPLAAVLIAGLILGTSPLAAGQPDANDASRAAASENEITLVQATADPAPAESAAPARQAQSQLKWRSYRTKSGAKVTAASPTASRKEVQSETSSVIAVETGNMAKIVWRRPAVAERTVAFESPESAVAKAAPKAARTMPNDPVNEPLRVVAPAAAAPEGTAAEPAATEPATTEPAAPETTPAAPETPAEPATPEAKSPSDTTLPSPEGAATEGMPTEAAPAEEGPPASPDSVHTAQQDLDRCPSVADLKKIKDITTNIKPKPPERSPGLRPWKDRAGQTLVAEGEFVDLVDSTVHVKTRDGQTVTLKAGDLSDEDEQFVFGLPPECSLGNAQFQPRNWAPTTFTWKASGLCHKPLYFEDVALERYGHSWGPFVQPFVSGAHFFVTVPLLPYKMGLEPPCECLYTLGYYRPGSCAPYTIDAFPLSVQGGLWEAGVWTGMIFLIP